jgi:nucleoside-diphosphate-sugar epimerase
LSNKVLLTGSLGFIGQHLIHKNTNQTYRCVLRAPLKQELSENFFITSLDSKTNWDGAFVNINTVIHLAAVAHNKSSDPDYINEVNVNGTINLAMQAAKSGVRRFVFISSIGVLGNRTLNNIVLDENSPILPQFEYAQSKAKAESELLKIAKSTGLEVVIIRPVLVYGANSPGNFGKLVNIVNKLPILPFGLCKNKRSFISVDNLVDFISVCIEHPKAKNEIFCITDGQSISIKDFTNAIAKGLNKNILQLPVPNFIYYLFGKLTNKKEQVEQLTGDLQVNSSKAEKLLDWTPPYTMAATLSRLTLEK